MITTIEQLDPNATYSYADYLTWRFQETVELWRGKIMRMAAPHWVHQYISVQLTTALTNHFTDTPCLVLAAPIDVRIPQHKDDTDEHVYTVLQPDICVLCSNTERNRLYGWVGIPDLVVEIASPSTQKNDFTTKKMMYEAAGVKEYWIVLPMDKILFLYTLENNKYTEAQIFTKGDTINSILFPDLNIPIHTIFQKLDDWAF
jgi:Uma2 family endonuclease